VTWRSTGVTIFGFGPGPCREILVEGSSVLLFLRPDGPVALEGLCPHAGGLLVDGTVTGDRITCAVHGAQFAIRTGAVLADPGGVEPPEGGVDALRSYPTRVRGGLIEVDL